MTDSLDRSGKGGMLAPFKVSDGTVSAPGFAFSSEPSTGFYRAGAGQLAASVGGTQIAVLTSAGLAATALSPTGSALPTNGLYSPGSNQLGFATNSIQAGYFDGSQNLNLAKPLGIASGGTSANTATAAVTALGLAPMSTAATASTLAQRTASGYLYATYFNGGSAYNENPTIGSVAVQNASNDGFFRFATITNFAYQSQAAGISIAADPGSGYPTSGTPGQAWGYY